MSYFNLYVDNIKIILIWRCKVVIKTNYLFFIVLNLAYDIEMEFDIGT